MTRNGITDDAQLWVNELLFRVTNLRMERPRKVDETTPMVAEGLLITVI
jgi:hypothetical protein